MEKVTAICAPSLPLLTSAADGTPADGVFSALFTKLMDSQKGSAKTTADAIAAVTTKTDVNSLDTQLGVTEMQSMLAMLMTAHPQRTDADVKALTAPTALPNFRTTEMAPHSTTTPELAAVIPKIIPAFIPDDSAFATHLKELVKTKNSDDAAIGYSAPSAPSLPQAGAAQVVQETRQIVFEDSPKMQPSKTVNTPFGQVGWTQDINQHIVVMVNEKSQSIRLTLNPPELGPVEVNVKIENKVASVQFLSAAPEVQKALQDGIPVLQEMLSQSGIDLGKTDISNKQSSRGNKFFSASRDASKAEKEDETASIIQTTSSTRLNRFGIINTYA